MLRCTLQQSIPRPISNRGASCRKMRCKITHINSNKCKKNASCICIYWFLRSSPMYTCTLFAGENIENSSSSREIISCCNSICYATWCIFLPISHIFPQKKTWKQTQISKNSNYCRLLQIKICKKCEFQKLQIWQRMQISKGLIQFEVYFWSKFKNSWFKNMQCIFPKKKSKMTKNGAHQHPLCRQGTAALGGASIPCPSVGEADGLGLAGRTVSCQSTGSRLGETWGTTPSLCLLFLFSSCGPLGGTRWLFWGGGHLGIVAAAAVVVFCHKRTFATDRITPLGCKNWN